MKKASSLKDFSLQLRSSFTASFYRCVFVFFYPLYDAFPSILRISERFLKDALTFFVGCVLVVYLFFADFAVCILLCAFYGRTRQAAAPVSVHA